MKPTHQNGPMRGVPFTRFGLIALLVGVVLAALSAAGWRFQPAQFFPAYLVALLFWLGISLGCLAIVMLHHLTGGGWGLPVRRVLEASASTLPLLAALFLPLLWGLPELYLWARPDAVAGDEILQKKVQYLNIDGFQMRAAAYFIIWILLSFVLNRWSAGTDAAGEPQRRRWLSLLSGPGLVLWCLTVTFAAIDWGMSLEPHWFSSIYGVLFIGGQGVAGLSLAILAVTILRDHPPWSEDLTLPRLNDLASLLLAFVLFWSYVSFTQFLIIWSGNLPEETPYYLHRSAGGWQWIAAVLATLHFLVPFLLLLSRQTKRNPRWLAGIAALLLVMRFVDLYWLVMPTFSPGRFTLHWLNLVAPLAVGGLWLAMFTWRLSVRAALPVYDLPVEEEPAHDAARATN